MAIDGHDGTDIRRVTGPVGPAGPATFDERELDLAAAVRTHVMVRDACLAPASAIADKLDRLDLRPWATTDPTDRAADGATGITARVSVVAQMATLRRRIRDTGALLPSERRRLVLLDVLASTQAAPAPDLSWSRTPVDLIGEAAAGIGHNISDVRRLARRLDIARHALPPVEIGPSTTRAVAESLRTVVGLSAGAAVAQAVLLLSDRVPTGWSPSSCGAVLLDPAPAGPVRFLGTHVARHDLAAFTDDLATLRVAADLSPVIHRYAAAMLPELAHDLQRLTVADNDEEAAVLHIAGDLALRTAALLPRGFRRFDRAGRSARFAVTD